MQFIEEKIQELERTLKDNNLSFIQFHTYSKLYDFSEESLLFLIEVRKLVEKLNMLTDKDFVDLSIFIYKKFIKTNSKYEINISSKLRKTFEEELKKALNPNTPSITRERFIETVFKPAFQENFKLIKDNALANLIKEDKSQEFLKKLLDNEVYIRCLSDFFL